jgi:hypothetical protein
MPMDKIFLELGKQMVVLYTNIHMKTANTMDVFILELEELMKTNLKASVLMTSISESRLVENNLLKNTAL